MIQCLLCGAPATRATRETDEPLCPSHGGGEPDDTDPDLGER